MFVVTGAVRIDLRIIDKNAYPSRWLGLNYDDSAVGMAMQEAVYAPRNAEVVFIVGRGQYPPYSALAILRDEGEHLGRITVECEDPDTVKRWAIALRGEEAA